MQSVYKDNELEAHVILAHMFNDGWLPVQQTLLGKSVRAWLKEYHPEAAQRPAEALQVLLLKLKEQHMESGMLPSAITLLCRLPYMIPKHLPHPPVWWVWSVFRSHPHILWQCRRAFGIKPGW